MSDLLDSALAAVRDHGGADDGELASITRSRVRRTLEAQARGRRQLVSFLTMTTILFGGTMSWALSTGRTRELWAAVAEPAVVQAPSPAPVEPTSERAPPKGPPAARFAGEGPTRIAAVPMAEESWPVPPPSDPPPIAPAPPAPEPDVAPAPAPPVARAIPQPTPIEVLYQRAHDLHFRGTDHAATLAAWDAYLATEPRGRFVVEARYNRALILIRLGKLAEARAALEPFARGEVEPAGYRRPEASQLVDRLARLLRGD